MNRIGLTFHRTFSLSRSAIRQILELSKVVSEDGNITRQKLEELSNLGTIYIEAMPRYGYGSGLLDKNYFPSLFGHYVLTNDVLLDRPNTQWLMHYHLSAPHGPGPEFWHELITNFFYPGNIFSNEEIADHIGNFIWKKEGKTLSTRAVKSTATIFIGTYTKSDGLGNLNILEQTLSGRYQVCKPHVPQPYVLGVALIDYWKNHFPNRVSISYDTFIEEDFKQLFLLSKAELDESLRFLQQNQIVEVYRSAPPHQIVQLQTDSRPLLELIYGIE